MKRISIIFLFIIIMTACTRQPFFDENGNVPISVGNYTDREIDSVVREIDESLDLITRDIYSDSTEQGCVVYQYPYAGKEVRKGDTMTLYVSKGTTPKELKVAGLTLEEAQVILENDYPEYGEVYEYNVSVEEGRVFGVNFTEKGLTLYISKGRPDLKMSTKGGYVVKAVKKYTIQIIFIFID